MNTSQPKTKIGLLDLELNRLAKVLFFIFILFYYIFYLYFILFYFILFLLGVVWIGDDLGVPDGRHQRLQGELGNHPLPLRPPLLLHHSHQVIIAYTFHFPHFSLLSFFLFFFIPLHKLSFILPKREFNFQKNYYLWSLTYPFLCYFLSFFFFLCFFSFSSF